MKPAETQGKQGQWRYLLRYILSIFSSSICCPIAAALLAELCGRRTRP